MLYAAFLAEIWVFYDSKKTQISARKAATYSAVWCTSCNMLQQPEPVWRRFAEIYSSAIRQVLKLNQHETDGKKQTSSKECLEVFSATAGILFFSLTRLGPMRSQWSIFYHLQLGQKAMKTTWLKIPKCSLGLHNHPATSVFFGPPPRKLILKKKSWQLGRGNCFQIPESQSPLKSLEARECVCFFGFREILTRYVACFLFFAAKWVIGHIDFT